MSEETTADGGDESANERTGLMTDDERTVFDVIAENGIASGDKLSRKLDLERYEIRELTRRLEAAEIIVSEGRDSLAYNHARYALTGVGQQYAEGAR